MPQDDEFQPIILAALDYEIEVQEILAGIEDKREERAMNSGKVALPPDDVLERISRYRAANRREYRRSLEALDKMRRLRGG
ncbi:MAG: hypothetical protein WBC04_09260 [Candidatus Acidiferrales bacterium]